MKDTPRTDKVAWPETGLVEGHFARELETELTAVTEQRDELLRYNEEFRNETLICADCDAIRKEEYDQAIEQRDRLAVALWNMLNQEHGSAVKAGILLRSLNLQYLNPNTPDQERKSPASECSTNDTSP